MGVKKIMKGRKEELTIMGVGKEKKRILMGKNKIKGWLESNQEREEKNSITIKT